ncbi:MAG: efflux RND transporter periplasmic adaptor subunit [Verrucomicrobiota bacterium]
MGTETGQASKPSSQKRRWITVVVCTAIIVLTFFVLQIIYFTEPEAEAGGAVRRSAVLVETVQAETGTYQPVVTELGTVQAAQDVTLRPRVSGEIVEVSDSFQPGQVVSKGDMLVRIDPADYENALIQAKSQLDQILADLAIEMGRQEQARDELAFLEKELEVTDPRLILREPQLAAMRARIKSAEAEVEQAALALERTKIVAPFDAQVLDINAYVGSQVSPGDGMGRLIGMDEYWVIVTIPLSKVYWLNFSDQGSDQEASKVILRNHSAWPEGVYREGRVQRLIGTLDETTRLARVLVSVENPLARGLSTDTHPPLLVGAVLEARIFCRPIEGVARVKRDYVRDRNTIWLDQDSGLKVNELDIVFQDSDYAYVRSGIANGDHIVKTQLRTVADGLELNAKRVEDEPIWPEQMKPQSGGASVITDRSPVESSVQ